MRLIGLASPLVCSSLVALAACSSGSDQMGVSVSGASSSSSSSSSGYGPHPTPAACPSLTSAGHWTLEAPQGVHHVFAYGAKVVETGLAGAASTLVLVPALDAQGAPALVAATFDGEAPSNGVAPSTLKVDVLPLSPSPGALPWSDASLRVALRAPGKIIALLGPGQGSSGGRSHWLELDAATRKIEVDRDLGQQSSPTLIAASAGAAESAWIPSGSSEANHYFLQFLSDAQSSLASAPSLDCDAAGRIPAASMIPKGDQFLSVVASCSAQSNDEVSIGPWKDGGFVGAPHLATLDYEPDALWMVPKGSALWLVGARKGELRATPIDQQGSPQGPSSVLGDDSPYVTFSARVGDEPVFGWATHDAFTVKTLEGATLAHVELPPSTPTDWRSVLAGAGVGAQTLLVLAEEPKYRVGVERFVCAP